MRDAVFGEVGADGTIEPVTKAEVCHLLDDLDVRLPIRLR